MPSSYSLLSLALLTFLLCACDKSRPVSPTQIVHNPFSTASVPEPQTKYINSAGKVIRDRVLLPEGFQRISPNKNSFGYYLQNFPLKPHGTKVYLHDGTPKYTQGYHLAVLDIDTGKRNLQQCADAIIRLRAEYLYAQADHDDIQFHFTNGFLAKYSRWKTGERISVKDNTVKWYNATSADSSYKTFRKYMDMVFSFAGTLSLEKELTSKSIKELDIGDVFIQGGSPGHAVIVVDVAVHDISGEKLFLIAQSYMPAQDIHIIKKNKNLNFSPWYSAIEIQQELKIPEWSFSPQDLKSF